MRFVFGPNGLTGRRMYTVNNKVPIVWKELIMQLLMGRVGLEKIKKEKRRLNAEEDSLLPKGNRVVHTCQ